jgi:endonuclease YncB( thermonuclease family)
VTFVVDRAGTIRYVHPGGEFHPGAGGDHWPDHGSCAREYEEIVALVETLLDEPPAAPQENANEADDALDLGRFRLDPRHGVVDGDTLRVVGEDESLRLIGLDAEELFRSRTERDEAARDFEAYARARRGGARRPAKFGTPAGELARDWMRETLAGSGTVRLELDRPGRTRGYFGRLLVHVFAGVGDEEIHVNREAIRAGISPYFVKYGRSARYDAAFVEAEREARRAGRGIWSNDVDHYPDYDERLAWWHERARAIDAWERQSAACAECVRLADDGAWETLIERAGREVVLFGELGAPRLDDPPYLLPLRHRLRRDINIVAWTPGPLAEFAAAAGRGDHVRVRGRVSMHRGRPQFLADDLAELRAP